MKNIIRIFTLFFIFISLIFTTSVKAAAPEIKVVDIKVKETSETISVESPTLNDNNITSNITFNQKDDYVTFDFVIKNNSEDKYKISSVTDNNKNENISVEYEYSEDYIDKGNNASVSIKLKYKTQLLNVDKLSLNNLTITFNLEKEDGSTSEIIVNPTTHDALLHYLGLLVITIIGLILVIISKKKKKLGIGNILLILAVVLIPFAAIASEKYTTSIKFTNIDIIGKVETPNVDPVTPTEPTDDPIIPVYAILLPGDEFNEMLPASTNTFRQATEEEYNTVFDSLTENNLISSEDSLLPVFMWESNGNVLFYSESPIIYMNEDSANMFADTTFITIDLTGLNGTNVEDMSSMFEECTSLTNINLDTLITGNVTTMANMFKGNESLTVLDLSNFDIGKVEDTSNMFNGCTSLMTIYISDVWDSSEYYYGSNDRPFEYDDDMFKDCYSLVGEEGTFYSEQHVDQTYACVDGTVSNGVARKCYFTYQNHEKNFAILTDGDSFNDNLKSIDANAKDFRKATTEEYNLVKNSLNEDNIISANNSPKKVYMWRNGDDILYYSSVEPIYMNPDSSKLFYTSDLISIDLSELDNSKVTDMSSMFQESTSLVVADLSTFNLIDVSDVSSMFEDCISLETIYISKEWDDNIYHNGQSGMHFDNSENMFKNCISIEGESGTTYDSEIYDQTYAKVDKIYGSGAVDKGYFTLKGHVKQITYLMSGTNFNTKLNSFNTNNKSFRKATDVEYNSVKNTLTNSNIVSLANKPLVYIWETNNDILYYSESSTIKMNSDSSHMFENSGLTSIDLSKLDSGTLTNMSYMFSGCTNLTTIDLSTLDTVLVEDMSYMFNGCSSLTNVYFEDPRYAMNNSNVLASVASIIGEDNNIITILIPLFFILSSIGIYIIIKKIGKKNIEVTIGSITVVVVAGLLITLIGGHGLKKLLASVYYNDEEVFGFDTRNVTTMKAMFKDCSSLTALDLSVFSIESLENADSMFENCSSLETIYVSDKWDPEIYNMGSLQFEASFNGVKMFKGCTSIVGGNGTFYKGTAISYDAALARVDGETYDTRGYFTLKGYQKTIPTEAYLTNFSMPGYYVTSNKEFRRGTKEELMSFITNNPNKTLSLISSKDSPADVLIWQTDDAILYYSLAETIYLPEDSSSLFANTDFTYIDLSGFNTSEVENMSSMFYNCLYLEEVNLTGFDTSHVSDMSSMFEGCEALEELDLSSFNADQIYDTSFMFSGCTSLETIYVSDTWPVAVSNGSEYYMFENDSGMFYNCYSLVGEKGTVYSTYEDNDSYAPSALAQVDEGLSNPGLFTNISERH